MFPRARGGWVWILMVMASSAANFPPDGLTRASAVGTELPWWMWLLPAFAVAVPAGLYRWRHRPPPPVAPPDEPTGGFEEPAESSDPLERSQSVDAAGTPRLPWMYDAQVKG